MIMKQFCTNCGKELAEGAVFCTSCGARRDGPFVQAPAPAPVQPAYTAYPGYQVQPGYPAVPAGAHVNKRARKVRPYVLVGVLLLVVALVGAGVWKAGEMTGLWHDRAVEREFNKWTKQKDLKAEEKAIQEVIDAMKAQLQAGNMEEALAYVHPDCRDDLRNRFTSHQDKIPLLISLMDDCKLTYLSTDTGNYETLRMATVQIGIPTPAAGQGMPDTGTAMIVMVKAETGWVVEDIS